MNTVKAIDAIEGQLYKSKTGVIVRVKQKRLVSKNVTVESMYSGNDIILEADYPLEIVDDCAAKKQMSFDEKSKYRVGAVKHSKTLKASDIITPMLQAKTHTARQIAEAVVAKLPSYNLEDLVKQIAGPRLYNAKKAGLDVALIK